MDCLASLERLIFIGAKIGKCQCHSDPKAPITDAKRAPQEVAEAHEDARQQAKELRKLRATKGSLPEDFASPSPRRSRTTAQSAKQGEPLLQQTDVDQVEQYVGCRLTPLST